MAIIYSYFARSALSLSLSPFDPVPDLWLAARIIIIMPYRVPPPPPSLHTVLQLNFCIVFMPCNGLTTTANFASDLQTLSAVAGVVQSQVVKRFTKYEQRQFRGAVDALIAFKLPTQLCNAASSPERESGNITYEIIKVVD